MAPPSPAAAAPLQSAGGDVARGPERDRPVRGPLVAQDLDLPDPDQHREDAGAAGGADAAVLGAPAAGRRPRAGGRPGPVPRPRASALARPLGLEADRLAGGAAARGGDARDDRARDRGAAAGPAR